MVLQQAVSMGLLNPPQGSCCLHLEKLPHPVEAESETPALIFAPISGYFQ